MPAKHSQWFEQYVSTAENGLKPELNISQIIADNFTADVNLPSIASPDGRGVYDKLTDLVREINDAHNNITASLNEDNQWVRDARNSLPLDDPNRIQPGNPIIESNNALLRTVSRIKAVDYAIGKKLGDKGAPQRMAIMSELHDYMNQLQKICKSETSDKHKQQAILKAETHFNTFLIQSLHEAGLTKGCKTSKDCEALLRRYRDLSSLMVPARTLVTITYDNDSHLLHRESQIPVTVKSKEQIKQIDKMEEVTLFPLGDSKNGQSTSSYAIQEANQLFISLMRDNTRALPAQARKVDVSSAKNAFIVKSELFRNIDSPDTDIPDKPDFDLWLGRTASPVYLGKGENGACILEQTRQNLSQIKAAANAADTGHDFEHLAMVCLNTDTRLFDQQHTIVTNIQNATDTNDSVSVIPVNLHGTFVSGQVATGVDIKAPIAPGQKKNRAVQAAQVILENQAKSKTLCIINCASGQDRTGTVIEYAIQEWIQQCANLSEEQRHHLELVRAQAANAAEISSHHLPGSPGMKSVSIASNIFGGSLFSKQATDQFYRASADTNKKSAVGTVHIDKPSNQLIAEYLQALEAFENELNRYKIEPNDKKIKLISSGQAVLEGLPNKYNCGLNKSNDLATYIYILKTGTQALADPCDTKYTRKLTQLSCHLSGKRSKKWMALGATCLLFAGAILVVGGVLAAIPSGGTSLLVTVAATVGISVTALATTGLVTAAGTSAVGVGLFSHGREKGLAKDTKKLAEDINQAKPPTN